MKKSSYNKILRVFFTVLAALTCLPGSLRAAPSNGMRLPAGGRAEAGYEFNVLYKRPLDRSYGNIRSVNHFYFVSLGLLDWLSIDAKVGLGGVLQKGGAHLPKLDYRTGFAGGYGFRIKAYDNKKYGLSAILGAQHISVHPQDKTVNDKYECFLDDWQISALAAKKFKYLGLYVGIKGSDLEYVYNINKHDKKRRYSKYHVGFIGGIDVYPFKDNKFRASVEARFFDETAFSTAVAYMF